jgi:hypothetical protein
MRTKYADYAKKGACRSVLTAKRPGALFAPTPPPPVFQHSLHTAGQYTATTQAARRALPEHPQRITRKHKAAISGSRAPP